jgi:WD40 repeat protein
MYDAATGKRLRTLSELAPVMGVTWSPDGRSVASNDPLRGQTAITSVETGEEMMVLKDTHFPLAWSPSGQAIASGAPNKAVVIIHERSGKVRHVLAGHNNYVTELIWSPNSRQLASSSLGEKRVLLWDAEKGKQALDIGPLPGPAQHVRWSPDGQLLTFVVAEVGWHIWDVAKNRLVNDPKDWQAGQLVPAPDGQNAMVLPGLPGLYRLRDLATGKWGAQLPRNSGTAVAPAFSPDGRLLALPVGGTVELWRGDLKHRLRTLRGPSSPDLQQLGFSQDGTLVLGQAGRCVHVWEASTGQYRSAARHRRAGRAQQRTEDRARRPLHRYRPGRARHRHRRAEGGRHARSA